MFRLALRHFARAIGYGTVGALLLGLVLYIVYLEKRPDLEPWHEAELEAEFRSELLESKVRSFAEYRALEDALFVELDERVYSVPAETRGPLMRYTRGSLSDPSARAPNWNRSIERPNPDARAVVLLLHGLSDSPYSMRALAELLEQHGAWVLALRVPGHGTAPVGLADTDWESFVAATRLAAVHLTQGVAEDVPFYMIGYSNGAALAVFHSLVASEDDALRVPDALVLLAPAIGITRAAALAVWQARLGHFLGLDKLAWNSILPEYDPYKYNSFAVNAGEQMFQLTRAIAARLDAAARAGTIDRFPRTLAFQSLVDATVISGAVVDRLLRRLAPVGHELVLFDVNRVAELQPFLRRGDERLRDRLASDGSLPFAFTLVTNVDEQSRLVVARRKEANGGPTVEHPLGLAWPRGVYSLSHVSVPFRPDDPVYGYAAPPGGSGIALGRLEPRGERGVLLVSATDAMRLRANPFFPYLEERVLNFFRLQNP